MPRGKSNVPPVLAAAEKFRRAEERVAETKKQLRKAEAARSEAETTYYELVSASLAARHRQPAHAAEEGSAAPTA